MSARIGVDAREVLGKPTGVGRYLGRLLDEWAVLPEAEGHRFRLYVPGSATPPVSARWAGERFEHRAVTGGGGTIWEQRDLRAAVARDGLDVFFAPAYTAPLRLRVPFVVTIHDVSFAAHPEWFSWREGLRRRWLTGLTARRARLVLTDSEFSRREIVDRLGVAPAGVRVVRLGVDRRPAAPADRPPLVLFVGSILNRRHVLDLVSAFAPIAREQPAARLVVAGDNRTLPFEDPAALAGQLGILPQVQVQSYVTDRELDDLYGQAAVFVFLSEYEGFGLPPLEALAAGVPVVVADTPVARETCGDAAAYVAVGDIAATTAAIRRLLTAGPARATAVSRAAAVVSAYSWTATARDTLGVLEQVAGGSPLRS